ncbi:MAG: hypothetical protein HZB24_01565 [Desulfobacterales bacterium]|nr:hypothetical protein [Desulfobacterales bacterium]
MFLSQAFILQQNRFVEKHSRAFCFGEIRGARDVRHVEGQHKIHRQVEPDAILPALVQAHAFFQIGALNLSADPF